MRYFDPGEVLRRSGLSAPANARYHLAVFAEPFLSCLYSGKKTLESRLTVNRVAPWGQIAPGDVVFVKRSSGPVEAVFTAGKVEQFDLAQTPLSALKAQYASALCADAAFWQRKQHCRYAVIMEITALHRIPPFSIEKKGMQTWILL